MRRRDRPVSFGSIEDRSSSLFDEDKSAARSSSRKQTPDDVLLGRSVSGALSSGRSSGCERDASGVLSLSSDGESQPARGKQLAWSRKRRARMGGGSGGSLAPNPPARADAAFLSEKEDSKGPAADSGSAFASRFSEEICCMMSESRRLPHSEEGERTGCCFVFASGAVVIWGGDAVGGTEMKLELLSNLMWFFGRFASRHRSPGQVPLPTPRYSPFCCYRKRQCALRRSAVCTNRSVWKTSVFGRILILLPGRHYTEQ